MKVFFTIVFLTIWISVAHAQLSIGPVAGINFSGTTGGESYTNYDRDYGWKAGGILQVPLSKKYFLNPELIFDSKSYKYNFAGEYLVNNVVIPSYFYEHLTFGYIETPFTIKRKFSSGFHASAGIFAGYQVSQRKNETVDYGVEVGSIVTNVTATSTTREITADRFQFGLQAGIGYVKSGFDLSLTSQYHLTPLYDFFNGCTKEIALLQFKLGVRVSFQFSREDQILIAYPSYFNSASDFFFASSKTCCAFLFPSSIICCAFLSVSAFAFLAAS
jgi:hypothetical protein